MRSVTYVCTLFLCQLLSAPSQIATPTNKGAEIPDDYADALNRLEKDIGSGIPATRTQKKLHKRADADELQKFKTQVDARKKKRKAKGLKGELSPEEILKKTDEELREMYYAKQKEKHAQMDEMYQTISEKLKGATTEDEKEMHMKRIEMIEKRKQSMQDDNEVRAQQVSILVS